MMLDAIGLKESRQGAVRVLDNFGSVNGETRPTITARFRLAEGGQCERVADVLVGLEVVIGRAAHEVLAVRVIMTGNEEDAAGAARRFGGDRHLLHRQGVVAARVIRYSTHAACSCSSE